MAYRCVTLLTDYGYAGGFVGALRAVAFGIAPDVPVIDLDHRIPPQDVRLGALRLERMMPYVPPGVHVAVVDPGVGGNRRGVLILSGGRAFVGPDNGLLAWAAEASGEMELAVELEEDRYWLSPRSRTFDGRDVFVPVAAHLATGVEPAAFGRAVSPSSLVRLERPVARRLAEGSYEVEVLQVDSFGNVQLSAGNELELIPGMTVEVAGDGGSVVALVGGTFGEVAAGEAIVLIDSDGCLSVAINGGDAAEGFAMRPRDRLTIRASP